MKRIGSQMRESLEEAGMQVESIDPISKEAVLLEDGRRSLWAERDDHAGYVVEINGVGYEFISSLPDKAQGDIRQVADDLLAAYP